MPNNFDLLNRDERPTKYQKSWYNGKWILITGACGTIGTAIACNLRENTGAGIVGIDTREEAIFWARRENPGIEYRLMNTWDLTLKEIQKFDIVIHTAAYKHVTMCQDYPERAIKNNAALSAYISGLCAQCPLCRFVFVSTDKTVEAKGVMGKSKYVAERVVDSWRKLGANVTIIRLSNVLDSSGSVTQIWEKSKENIPVVQGGFRRWIISKKEAATGILRAIQGTTDKQYLFAIKPDVETEIKELARGWAREKKCQIEYIEPGKAEKTRELFSYENQRLQRVEGNLYAIL